jgi:hypothetical protein
MIYRFCSVNMLFKIKIKKQIVALPYLSDLVNSITSQPTNLLTDELIAWNKVSLKNQIVTQLVKNSLPFMEPADLLPCSQEPVTGPYTEPRCIQSTPSHPICLSSI